MSEWGDILSAVETEMRAALPDLPAGELGFEIADGKGHDLPASKMPHVFLRNAVEAGDALAGGYGVEVVTLVMTFSVWTRGETKEEALARLFATMVSCGNRVHPDWIIIADELADRFPSKARTLLVEGRSIESPALVSHLERLIQELDAVAGD